MRRPDDRPGGVVVRGAEAYRPQPGVSGCEPGHDRVSFGNLRGPAAVDAGREDASQLGSRSGGLGIAGEIGEYGVVGALAHGHWNRSRS